MMNALQSYYSDNESDDGSKPKKSGKGGDTETNYDDVGMDISEESGEEDLNAPVVSSTVESKKEGSPENVVHKTDEPKLSPKHKVSEEREGSLSREGSSGSSGKESKEDRDYKRRHDVSRNQRDSRHDRRHRDDHRSGRRRDRSRSHERRRRSRSRERRRRSRSRSRERRKFDMRREAQQKYASLRNNPGFDQNEMMRRTMQEQVAVIEKKTGISIPSYYNPATMNPLKIAEQERKKRLLWGNKAKPEPEASTSVTKPPTDASGKSTVWDHTAFLNDSDGKMAEKFKRLMGVKDAGGNNPTVKPEDKLKEQESFFSNMERQYEVARMTTHTNKGVGLGFSSQSYLPK